eukprot:GHUV01034736.1.p1 GENE.GHUV01034736.1~~GHUV01034736.1.p1  ORF type:complete len:174 (-),score=26.33 GHUV01034736.1:45-566(-)
MILPRCLAPRPAARPSQCGGSPQLSRWHLPATKFLATKFLLMDVWSSASCHAGNEGMYCCNCSGGTLGVSLQAKQAGHVSPQGYECQLATLQKPSSCWSSCKARMLGKSTALLHCFHVLYAVTDAKAFQAMRLDPLAGSDCHGTAVTVQIVLCSTVPQCDMARSTCQRAGWAG